MSTGEFTCGDVPGDDSPRGTHFFAASGTECPAAVFLSRKGMTAYVAQGAGYG
jgi:hypothetical protein